METPTHEEFLMLRTEGIRDSLKSELLETLTEIVECLRLVREVVALDEDRIDSDLRDHLQAIESSFSFFDGLDEASRFDFYPGWCPTDADIRQIALENQVLRDLIILRKANLFHIRHALMRVFKENPDFIPFGLAARLEAQMRVQLQICRENCELRLKDLHRQLHFNNKRMQKHPGMLHLEAQDDFLRGEILKIRNLSDDELLTSPDARDLPWDH